MELPEDGIEKGIKKGTGTGREIETRNDTEGKGLEIGRGKGREDVTRTKDGDFPVPDQEVDLGLWTKGVNYFQKGPR